ncbi:hypothetical protein P9112_007820 [Eukaryota sp. TZLM1-RC]
MPLLGLQDLIDETKESDTEKTITRKGVTFVEHPEVKYFETHVYTDDDGSDEPMDYTTIVSPSTASSSLTLTPPSDRSSDNDSDTSMDETVIPGPPLSNVSFTAGLSDTDDTDVSMDFTTIAAPTKPSPLGLSSSPPSDPTIMLKKAGVFSPDHTSSAQSMTSSGQNIPSTASPSVTRNIASPFFSTIDSKLDNALFQFSALSSPSTPDITSSAQNATSPRTPDLQNEAMTPSKLRNSISRLTPRPRRAMSVDDFMVEVAVFDEGRIREKVRNMLTVSRHHEGVLTFTSELVGSLERPFSAELLEYLSTKCVSLDAVVQKVKNFVADPFLGSESSILQQAEINRDHMKEKYKNFDTSCFLTTLSSGFSEEYQANLSKRIGVINCKVQDVQQDSQRLSDWVSRVQSIKEKITFLKEKVTAYMSASATDSGRAHNNDNSDSVNDSGLLVQEKEDLRSKIEHFTKISASLDTSTQFCVNFLKILPFNWPLLIQILNNDALIDEHHFSLVKKDKILPSTVDPLLLSSFNPIFDHVSWLQSNSFSSSLQPIFKIYSLPLRYWLFSQIVDELSFVYYKFLTTINREKDHLILRIKFKTKCPRSLFFVNIKLFSEYPFEPPEFRLESGVGELPDMTKILDTSNHELFSIKQRLEHLKFNLS